MKLRLIPFAASLGLLALASCKDKLPSQPPATDVFGPVAKYVFIGSAADVTGNGHDGSVEGANNCNLVGYRPGRFASTSVPPLPVADALSLSCGAYVTVPNSPALNFTGNNSFTICAWVNTANTADAVIVGKGPADGSHPGYQLGIKGGYAWGSVTDAATTVARATGTTMVTDGGWHLLTMVVAAHGSIAVYTDSSFQGSEQSASLEPELDNSAPLLIGASPTMSDFFTGLIDDVTIWGRALDPVEVAEQFHQGGWYAHSNPGSGSTNGWVKSSFGTTASILGICFETPQIAYACGFDGVILKSTDSGKAWTAQSTGTTTDLYRIGLDHDHGYGIAAGNNGLVLRTNDGGATWTPLTIPSPQENIRDVMVKDQYVVLVGGNGPGDGCVFTSSDEGITWTRSKTASGTIYGVASMPGGPTHFSVVGIGGQIFETTDFGNTWKDESVSGPGSDLMAVDFFGSLQWNGIATSFYGTTYHSHAGLLWTGQATGLTGQLRTVKMVSMNEAYTAGFDGIVLHTTDFGSTWSRETLPENPGTTWNQIVARDPNHLALVGNDGMLYWKSW